MISGLPCENHELEVVPPRISEQVLEWMRSIRDEQVWNIEWEVCTIKEWPSMHA